MSYPTDAEVKAAVEEAADAFWNTIVARLGPVEAGDYPPELVHKFHQDGEEHVRFWLSWNHPERPQMDGGWETDEEYAARLADLPFTLASLEARDREYRATYG